MDRIDNCQCAVFVGFIDEFLDIGNSAEAIGRPVDSNNLRPVRQLRFEVFEVQLLSLRIELDGLYDATHPLERFPRSDIALMVDLRDDKLVSRFECL